nr:hypothetical protein [Nostoc sp. B(2019)]
TLFVSQTTFAIRKLSHVPVQRAECGVKTNSDGKPQRKNIWHLTEAGKQWGTVIPIRNYKFAIRN